MAQTVIAYAGFWRRFAAIVIDGLVIWFPMLLISGVMIVAFKLADASKENVLSDVFLLGWPVALFFAYALYSAVMEQSGWQATVGKKALGLRVTDATHQRLTLRRASTRTMAKLFCIPTMGIGFLMCAFTAKKQALHDIVADCVVVRRQ
jgi:uncharacterized RDD family membrane protein YckC